MRSTHATKAEAIAEATCAFARDSKPRSVWFVAGHSSETTGWTVPPRFIGGLSKAGAPVDGAAKVGGAS